MKTTVRFTDKQFSELHSHLFPAAGAYVEEAAFCYANMGGNEHETVLVVTEVVTVPSTGFASQQFSFLELDQEFKVNAVLKARRQNQCLIEVHCHPHRDCDESVEFSFVDTDGQKEFHDYLAWKHPGLPWAALVFGRNCAAGSLWQPGALSGNDNVRVVVAGARFQEWNPGVERHLKIDARYDRQILAFGAEGQHRLQKIKLGIVGLGGLGSFLALEAAHLGFKNLVVVEDQCLEDTNLNRWISGYTSDVGEHKANLILARIKGIAPDCNVQIIRKSLQSQEALNGLTTCDVLSGSVDNDGARLILSELAAAHLIPYFDASSDVLPATDELPVRPGGRVHIWWPEQPCLLCSGELDRLEIRASLARKSEREISQRMGYGGGTKLNSPSVIHLNGVVASVLMGELFAWATGYRDLIRFQKYYGWRGMLRPCAAEKLVGCPVCNTLGKGAAANLHRYIVEPDSQERVSA